MKSLELFSGAGGLAKGLELEGFKHMAFVEFNRDACKTLRNNFDSTKVFEGDIRDYSFSRVGDVDIVAGGPPCQPFSLGGKHKASDDFRDMFPYALKAIRDLKPKAFVFENVKGLLRPTFSDYFKYILLRLKYPDCTGKNYSSWCAHLGNLLNLSECVNAPPDYRVYFKLINAAAYGIPQTRERVIIVGIRADIDGAWQFPEGRYSFERLLWEQYVSGTYWERHGFREPLEYTHSPHFMRRIEGIKRKYGLTYPPGKPWATMRDVLGRLPEPAGNHSIADHRFRGGARSYSGHTGSMFDFPSKTIKAGVHGVPGGENMIRYSNDRIRYLTIHEAKLIQGFPEDFTIHGAWGEAMRQIGNAVPCNLGEEIGFSIIKFLNELYSNSNKSEASISIANAL